MVGEGTCRAECSSLERVVRVYVTSPSALAASLSLGYHVQSHRPRFCQFEIELFDMSRHALPYRARTTDMSEKKRKRNAENGERPKKKAGDLPQGRVRVDMVENKEVLGPLLGM